MRRFSISLICASALLLGAVACSDDDDTSSSDESSSTTTAPAGGATTLAQGEDVELVGEDGLAGQTLSIDAEEENGEVTGEFRITENVVTIGCADTDTDGVVILGGLVREGEDFTEELAAGEDVLLALVIREGDPVSVGLFANDRGAESCTEMLESIPVANESAFVNVEAGSDIQTA